MHAEIDVNPPSISPSDFYHLIEKLQEDMPIHMDRSYLITSFPDTDSSQILAAMRFLKLVDNTNRPTYRLRLLADAFGEERNKRLKNLILDCYGAIINNGTVDLQTATFAQLEESFQSYFGVDGDVRRKCVTFFTTIANDAGIPLSPNINTK